MIKAPTKSVQEETEWDYAVSEGVNREGTDIIPKCQNIQSFG